MRDIHIAVIAFDQISPFHLSIPCIVFAEDKRLEKNQPWFQVQVCTLNNQTIRTNAGFDLYCHHSDKEIRAADIIIIPNWHDIKLKPSQELIELLKLKYHEGSKIVGLCLGTYVLAESGLLDQKKATTHWAWIEDFQKRFPKIQLDGKSLYVEDGNLLTSAGVAAGIDCCLHIVRKYYGHKVANRVARRLVVAPHREGTQAQFIEQPIAQKISDLRLSSLIDSIRQNLEKNYSIDDLAKQIFISRRTFTRIFKNATGMTFNDWLIKERIKYAQAFLENTTHSVEFIAVRCGFNSSVALRKQFQNKIGISPSNYRTKFKNKLHS